MRVLFVDDDEAITQGVKANHCSKGHSVDTAGPGEEALQLIQSAPSNRAGLSVSALTPGCGI